ncbi:MAG: molybdopterin-guanine dinucleotide biosynthesis protein A [Myxococcota bacterium]
MIGGQSRRFGSPKPLIEIDGETLLARGQRVLRDALGCEALVVGQPPSDTQVDALLDRRPGQGPLSGIETALSAADGRPIFVLATDLAGVTAEFIAWMVALQSSATLVAPVRDGRLQPLCALWNPEALAVVSAQLDRDKRAVMGVVDRITTREITDDERRAGGFETPGLLDNINSMSDLSRFRDLPR